MSLQVKKEAGVKYDPVFLHLDLAEDIPGGITVATDRFPTTTKEIKKGALLNDGGSGLWNVIKTVKLSEAAETNATILQVEKPHLFIKGEFINMVNAAATIIRVSATAIEIEAEIGNITIAEGTVLPEAASKADKTAKYTANAILRDTIKVRETGVETLLDNISAGAVVRGTVDESELPYFVTDEDKESLTDRIRFA